MIGLLVSSRREESIIIKDGDKQIVIRIWKKGNGNKFYRCPDGIIRLQIIADKDFEIRRVKDNDNVNSNSMCFERD